MSELTTRAVIDAANSHDPVGSIIAEIEATGCQIVPKPTGDKLTAAIAAYGVHMPVYHTDDEVAGITAAIAAAESYEVTDEEAEDGMAEAMANLRQANDDSTRYDLINLDDPETVERIANAMPKISNPATRTAIARAVVDALKKADSDDHA